MSAFFVTVIYCPQILAKTNCKSSPHTSLEKATVKWVYDGDTVLLQDKRKIRIIGINTPETRHHKQKTEAYGAKAREALRELLKGFNYQIYLEYDQQRKDKYSRILAHVFLPNGTNLASWLLRKGYARTLVIPPNVKFTECYKQSEKIAQKESLNIWRLKSHRLQSAATISDRVKGFVRLSGKIILVTPSPKQLLIELDSKSGHPIQIKIRKHNLRYFESVNLSKLTGKRIIVSGMLKNNHGKQIVRISHPSQIEILPL